MRSILLPIDFSKTSESALLFGLKLAKKEKANLIILHVVSPYMGLENNVYQIFDYGLYIDERRKATEDYIAKFKSQNLLEKVVTEVCCESGYVSEVILNYSEKRDVDLIVMGSVGAGNISRILMGSNTQFILGISKTPLMIIPLGFKFESYNKKICFATDFNFKLNKKSVDLLESFQLVKSSLLQFVHISKEDNPLLKDKYSRLVALLFNKFKTKIKYIVSNKLEISLEAFMQASESTLLILLPHNHNFLHFIFFKGHAAAVAKKLKYPILVLYEQN